MTFSGIRRYKLVACLFFEMQSFLSDTISGFPLMIWKYTVQPLLYLVLLFHYHFCQPSSHNSLLNVSHTSFLYHCISLLHVSSTRVFNVQVFHKHEFTNIICQPARKYHNQATCLLASYGKER